MPWCPKCKNEYRAGITLCSDCKVELVDELSEKDNLIPYFQVVDKGVSDRLMKYFEYSEMSARMDYDEENEVYVISIPKDQEKNARKLYEAFSIVEHERNETTLKNSSLSSKEASDSATSETDTDTTDDTYGIDEETVNPAAFDEVDPASKDQKDEQIEDKSSSAAAYVMKEDQYKDLKSTVWLFLLFGFAGLVVLLLNILDILNFIHGAFSQIIFGSLFLFFIYVGLSSHVKAKKIATEIDAENKLTKEINEWLKFNITEDFIVSNHNNQLSEEVNYLQITLLIKKMLLKEFGHQNTAYLDRLIEEFYSETFEENEEYTNS